MAPAWVQLGRRLTRWTVTIPRLKKSVCEEEIEGNKGEMKVRPRREIQKQDPCENRVEKTTKTPLLLTN